MGKKKTKNVEWPSVPNWKPFQLSHRDSKGKPSTSEKKEAIANRRQQTSPERKEGAVDVPAGWKEEPFKQEDNPHGRLFACSSFSCLFPRYREKYLREVWPIVKKLLAAHYIRADLDCIEGTLLVRTTPKTFDPVMILRARDMIRLLARSVPVEQAQRVLEDDVYSDIIEIGLANRDRFLRRQNRLIGPDGNTLKAIEVLTSCYVLIHGKTVAAVGPYNGLKQVRKIAQDAMKNIHPVYNIKVMLIKTKLAADPKLANENWDRFLPKIPTKTLSKRRKPFKVCYKSEYTPFPPEQPKRKVDKELEEGTYFMADAERRKVKSVSKKEKQEEVTKKRLAERAAVFVPPKEPDFGATPAKKRKIV